MLHLRYVLTGSPCYIVYLHACHSPTYTHYIVSTLLSTQHLHWSRLPALHLAVQKSSFPSCKKQSPTCVNPRRSSRLHTRHPPRQSQTHARLSDHPEECLFQSSLRQFRVTALPSPPPAPHYSRQYQRPLRRLPFPFRQRPSRPPTQATDARLAAS
jgi:hypothetical protein